MIPLPWGNPPYANSPPTSILTQPEGNRLSTGKHQTPRPKRPLLLVFLMRRILTNNLQELSVAPRTPIPFGMRS